LVAPNRYIAPLAAADLDGDPRDRFSYERSNLKGLAASAADLGRGPKNIKN